MEKAEEYRERLSEHRARDGENWRTPPALREEITAWASEVRSKGYGVRTIAREIGLSPSSLRRWLLAKEQVREFLRVRVSPGREGAIRTGLSVESPGGYRLKGLSLDEAVEVLRRL